MLRVRRDVWSLRTRQCFRALERAFYAGCNRFGFRLIHFSVRHNHVHLIGEADDKEALSRGMQGLAVRMSKALNRLMQRRGSVFADRYYVGVLKTVVAVRAVMDFVLQNFRWEDEEVEDDDPNPLASIVALVLPRSALLRAEHG
jgi:REP element-mobilizing transposase RayT